MSFHGLVAVRQTQAQCVAVGQWTSSVTTVAALGTSLVGEAILALDTKTLRCKQGIRMGGGPRKPTRVNSKGVLSVCPAWYLGHSAANRCSLFI